MPSGSYACFRCATPRPRLPNESDWVPKRATHMVLGAQNEGAGWVWDWGWRSGGPKSGESGEIFEKHII